MLHVICTGNCQIKGTLFFLMMRTLNMSQLNLNRETQLSDQSIAYCSISFRYCFLTGIQKPLSGFQIQTHAICFGHVKTAKNLLFTMHFMHILDKNPFLFMQTRQFVLPRTRWCWFSQQLSLLLWWYQPAQFSCPNARKTAAVSNNLIHLDNI